MESLEMERPMDSWNDERLDELSRRMDLAQFDTPADYYATRAHDHPLDRPRDPPRPRPLRPLRRRRICRRRARRRLPAPAMWCAQARISSTPRPDHAAYLTSWLRVLRAEPRSLITVAAKAQAALD